MLNEISHPTPSCPRSSTCLKILTFLQIKAAKDDNSQNYDYIYSIFVVSVIYLSISLSLFYNYLSISYYLVIGRMTSEKRTSLHI